MLKDHWVVDPVTRRAGIASIEVHSGKVARLEWHDGVADARRAFIADLMRSYIAMRDSGDACSSSGTSSSTSSYRAIKTPLVPFFVFFHVNRRGISSVSSFSSLSSSYSAFAITSSLWRLLFRPPPRALLPFDFGGQRRLPRPCGCSLRAISVPLVSGTIYDKICSAFCAGQKYGKSFGSTQPNCP